MIKRFLTYLILPIALLTSCIGEEEFEGCGNENFEALWQLIDERYCFFAQAEEEFGLDWNDVYDKYKPIADTCRDELMLFDLLGDMLRELRDGHVNLSSMFGTSYYWDWQLKHPINFSDSIQRNYLGTDFRMTNGIKYNILPDSIGYVYVESFSGSFGTNNLSLMLYNLKECKAIILDIRGNGGGMITSAEKLASIFIKEELHYGYMQHKTGKGHNDFSTPEPLYLEPSESSRWLRPVVVLTNRSVYSAANHFVLIMRELPHVAIVGDKTGGGSGMPLTGTLPNGWRVRLSACPTLDVKYRHTEFGIDPDIKVDITSEDWQKGRDTIIETAKALIFEYYNKKEEKEG